MTDKNKNNNNSAPDDNTLVLTDEVTGEEVVLHLAARYERGGDVYLAFDAPDGGPDEYVILKQTESDGEVFLESIEDDDEYEEVEDYFLDLLFGEVHYD